jgi:hypothetical protein
MTLPALYEVIRLRQVLERIERGATSVLLDAALKDQPIHRDVLQAIAEDARAALTNGERNDG